MAIDIVQRLRCVLKGNQDAQDAADEITLLRGLLRRALDIRSAPRWPFPGGEATAKASAKWWKEVESALPPNQQITGA